MRRLQIAVIGLGTAGAAAALALHRAGHDVVLLERVPDPGPVGAGILLQPTGMAVLAHLGLLDEVLARGARVGRLHGCTASGRLVMDLEYDTWRTGAFGLGVHRGILFSALCGGLERDGIDVRTGVDVTAVQADPAGPPTLATTAHGTLGPFDLVVAADGARSVLRAGTGLVRRARPYPWGALWAIVPDADEAFAGVLAQTYRGTREMAGTLPSGRVPVGQLGLPGDGDVPCVSLFWSLRHDTLDGVRARGLEVWKAQVLALAPRLAPVLEHIGDPAQLLYAGYHDIVLTRWHTADAGLVVLGDAGHAMSPQLGQGANLALIDAWTLSQCLARLPAAAALAAYSARRRRHLRFYGAASRLLTPVFQSDLPVLGLARDAFMGPAARVPWLRGQMVQSLVGAKTGLFTTLDGDDAGLAQGF